MNTLDDLRATLDQHGHDAGQEAGLDPATRTRQVRGRVRRTRQRRAAGSVAAAVLAVVAVGGAVAGLPDRTPQPAEDASLGDRAPQSMDALGWTYRLADTVETDRDELRQRFGPSDRPRLVTWAVADDDQDVVVVLEGGDRWVSDAGDFEDHVVLPEGYRGDVLVTANRSGVALASYEVDESRPPDGVGSDGVHYRSRVGSRTLVAAQVGAPGETDLSFGYEMPRDMLSLSHACSGFPDDYAVNFSLDGTTDSLVIGSCDDRFDAGAVVSASAPDGVEGLTPGDASTARIWVSRSMDDSTPVDPGQHPEGRISLGVYAEETRSGPFRGVAWEREQWGHLFRHASSVHGPERSLVQRLDGEGPWLVATAVEASGRVTVRSLVDGLPQDSVVTSLADGSWDTYVPAGSGLFEARAGKGADRLRRLRLETYEHVD